MAVRLLLALLLLIGLMWLVQWLARANPQQRSNAFRLALLYGAGAILLLLVATGRIPWLFALIGAMVPWLQRFLVARQAWTTFKSSRGAAPGQHSEVSTRFLRMQLDHDSGDLDGVILEGRYRDRRLSELNVQQLQVLLNEYRSWDSQSAQLLEAYLDRHYGPDWRQDDPTGPDERGPASATDAITRDEASRILGVDLGASSREVIEAHRRLMQKLHPDRGGNDYLAAKINQAKDVLLKHGMK